MFNFRDLNLSGVQASSGSAMLPPGKYLCTVREAKIEPTRNGGAQLTVKLNCDAGSITDWIGIHNPNSAEAQRINREKLKALLVHGGHKDPDNIGAHGVESIKGLKVGVAVAQEAYKDKNGNEKMGSRVHYYFDKSELGDAAQTTSSGGDPMGGLDDDIPF